MIGDSRAQFIGDSRAQFIGDSRAQFQQNSGAQFTNDSRAQFQQNSGAAFQGASAATYDAASSATYIQELTKGYRISLLNSMKAIPGLQMWLDGADPAGTGTSPAVGSAVTTWVDKSGVGNNATGVGNPTYSSTGIVFNGASSFNTTYTSYSPSESVFFVFTPNIVSNQHSIFAGKPNGRGMQIADSSVGWFTGGGTGTQTNITASVGVRTLYEQLYSAGTVNIFNNGLKTVTASGSVPTGTGVTILGTFNGGGYFLNATMSEMIFFNTALTETQRQLVEGYLANKWNIQLPNNHPYAGDSVVASGANFQKMSGATFQGASAATFQGASAATFQGASGVQFIGDSRAQFIGDSRAKFTNDSRAQFEGESGATFQGASAAQFQGDSRAQFIGDSRANFIGDSRANFANDSRANFANDSRANFIGDSRANFIGDSRANFIGDSRAQFQQNSGAQFQQNSGAQFQQNSGAAFQGASAAQFQDDSRANFIGDSRAQFQGDSRAQFQQESGATFQGASGVQFQDDSRANFIGDSRAQFQGDSRANYNTASGNTFILTSGATAIDQMATETANKLAIAVSGASSANALAKQQSTLTNTTVSSATALQQQAATATIVASGAAALTQEQIRTAAAAASGASSAAYTSNLAFSGATAQLKAAIANKDSGAMQLAQQAITNANIQKASSAQLQSQANAAQKLIGVNASAASGAAITAQQQLALAAAAASGASTAIAANQLTTSMALGASDTANELTGQSASIQLAADAAKGQQQAEALAVAAAAAASGVAAVGAEAQQQASAAAGLSQQASAAIGSATNQGLSVSAAVANATIGMQTASAAIANTTAGIQTASAAIPGYKVQVQTASAAVVTAMGPYQTALDAVKADELAVKAAYDVLVKDMNPRPTYEMITSSGFLSSLKANPVFVSSIGDKIINFENAVTKLNKSKETLNTESQTLAAAQQNLTRASGSLAGAEQLITSGPGMIAAAQQQISGASSALAAGQQQMSGASSALAAANELQGQVSVAQNQAAASASGASSAAASLQLQESGARAAQEQAAAAGIQNMAASLTNQIQKTTTTASGATALAQQASSGAAALSQQASGAVASATTQGLAASAAVATAMGPYNTASAAVAAGEVAVKTAYDKLAGKITPMPTLEQIKDPFYISGLLQNAEGNPTLTALLTTLYNTVTTVNTSKETLNTAVNTVSGPLAAAQQQMSGASSALAAATQLQGQASVAQNQAAAAASGASSANASLVQQQAAAALVQQQAAAGTLQNQTIAAQQLAAAGSSGASSANAVAQQLASQAATAGFQAAIANASAAVAASAASGPISAYYQQASSATVLNQQASSAFISATNQGLSASAAVATAMGPYQTASAAVVNDQAVVKTAYDKLAGKISPMPTLEQINDPTYLAGLVQSSKGDPTLEPLVAAVKFAVSKVNTSKQTLTTASGSLVAAQQQISGASSALAAATQLQGQASSAQIQLAAAASGASAATATLQPFLAAAASAASGSAFQQQQAEGAASAANAATAKVEEAVAAAAGLQLTANVAKGQATLTATSGAAVQAALNASGSLAVAREKAALVGPALSGASAASYLAQTAVAGASSAAIQAKQQASAAAGMTQQASAAFVSATNQGLTASAAVATAMGPYQTASAAVAADEVAVKTAYDSLNGKITPMPTLEQINDPTYLAGLVQSSKGNPTLEPLVATLSAAVSTVTKSKETLNTAVNTASGPLAAAQLQMSGASSALAAATQLQGQASSAKIQAAVAASGASSAAFNASVQNASASQLQSQATSIQQQVAQSASGASRAAALATQSASAAAVAKSVFDTNLQASGSSFQSASTAHYVGDSRAQFQQNSGAQFQGDSGAQFQGDSGAQFEQNSGAQFEQNSGAQFIQDSAAQNLYDSRAQFQEDSGASFNTASGSTATVNILADLLVTPVTNMIPGVKPALWFDASDPNGDGSPVAEGSLITTWKDKANGNTATSVGVTQPIYTASTGHSAVQFFGSQGLTVPLDTTPLTGPFTIFVVASINDWSTSSGGNGRIVSFASSGAEGFAMSTDSNRPAVVGISTPSATFIAPTTTPTTTVPYIWEASITSTAVNVVGIVPAGKGGAFQTLSMPSTSYNSLSIGDAVGGTDSQLALDGNISEIIIFNSSLTNDQQQKIEGYLSWKWGLQNNLSTNHTFAPNATNLAASSARYLGVSAAQHVALDTLSNVGALIKTSVNTLINTTPVMWFDATDPAGTGVVPANNSIVTSWMDKSGKGNHANVSGTTTTVGATITVGKTPSNIYNATGLNGKPTIQFNGSQYFLGNLQAGSFSGQAHIFVVFSANSAGTNSRILSLGAGTGTTSDVANTAYAGFLYKTSPTGPNVGFIRNSTPSFSAIPSAWSAPFLWQGSITNTTTSVTGLTGGVPQTAQSALIGNLAPTSFAIGANTNLGGTDAALRGAGLASYLNGNISEMIVYNTTLTPSDIATVEAYLSWKWGIQMNLSPNNPYYPSSTIQGESAAIYRDASQATYKQVSGATFNRVSGSSYLGASTANFQGASTANYQKDSGANFQGASTANYQQDSGANFLGASTANYQKDSGANFDSAQQSSGAKYQSASSSTYQSVSAAQFQRDSGANFDSASSANFQGASTANYIGDSRAQFQQDSRSQFQQDSGANFQAASSANFQGASTANYIGDSRANFQQDSRSQFQQDSGANFLGASSANFQGASTANYNADSRANFQRDSGAQFQQNSGANFLGASSATASSAQVFQGIGNDPSSGKFVTPATTDIIQTIDLTTTYKSGYSARYVVIRAPTYMGDGLLNLSQVMVYDSTFSLANPVNIALGKLVYATSNQPKAAIITNGSTTAQSSPNVWESATLNPAYEYIEIDLGMPVNVYAVSLIGRNDCRVGDMKCPNRMNNIRVEFNLLPSTQGATYFNQMLTASSSSFQAASAAQGIRDSSAHFQQDSAATFMNNQKISGADFQSASAAQFQQDSMTQFQQDSAAKFLGASTANFQGASTANYNADSRAQFQQDSRAQFQQDSGANFLGASTANFQGASTANFQNDSRAQYGKDSGAQFQQDSRSSFLGASSATASSAQVFQGIGNDPSSGRFVTAASPPDTAVEDQSIVMSALGIFSGYKARYIVIRAPSFMGDGVLNLSQIMVYDKSFPTINKNNIAISRPVFATSNQHDTSLLTDGSKSVRVAPDVWQSATPDPSSEYLELDLGSVQNVYAIRLLGRDDCDPQNPLCPSRMRNVRIEMSLTPSALGASYLNDQSTILAASGAIASAANFQSVSTARYEGASTANYNADSRAQFQQDSRSQFQQDSGANFLGASTARYEGASTAKYNADSRAQFQQDSRSQFQQDSGANFQGASSANYQGALQLSGANYQGASTANFQKDSGAQYGQDSGANYTQVSGSSFLGASSATASSAQVFKEVGNDPTSGRVVTAASPSDAAVQDQTIIMSALGLKGGYKARYIVIRAPSFMGDGILNLSQVMVYDSTFGTTKKNIALGTTVFATSNQSVAPILTDGSKDVRIAPNVWQSATPDPASEYLEIDLGSVQNVYAIRLLGRADCDPSDPDCPSRMRNVRIEMSLTPSATAAPYFVTQAAAIALSGATASSANFQSASTARYEGASTANYAADSRAQFQQDSRSQLQQDSGANFQAASSASFEGASTANFQGASTAQSLKDSGANFQQDSGAKFQGASSANFQGASTANFQKDSGAQYGQDSGANYTQVSGSSFLGASSATASSAQVFKEVGNDPTSGRFVTAASPSDEDVEDQTIVMNSLGIRAGYRARYIVIRAPSFMGDGILNLSQIIVYDKTFPTINKNNIAFGKQVYATSNQQDTPLLTDGSTDVRVTPDVWQSATPDPASEYLEIDLGSVQSVYAIRLLGRYDCDPENPLCPSRMRNVRIEMSLTPSASAAPYFTTQATSLALSGATASSANFLGASTAQFEGASSAQQLAAEKLTASTASASAAQQLAAEKLTSASGAVASSAQAFSTYGDDPDNGRFILPTADIVQEIPVNLYKGRYVRVMPSAYKGDGYLSISQIMVCDQTGINNVALGRPVFASSSFSADPSIVVDGHADPRAAPKFWESSSNDRSSEFIEVDLGSVQTITAIRLIGRNDCPPRLPLCGERMLHVRVQINSTTTLDAEAAYLSKTEELQASSATASSAQYQADEAFTASSANASSAEFTAASAADASTAQYLTDETFTVSAADASTAQYAAYKELSESAAYASGAQLNEAIGMDTAKGRFIFPNKTNDQTIMTSGATGRYVRIRPSVNNGDGYIHISQVAVFDRVGNNIALGKPTYGTSFYPGTSESNIITDGTLEPRNPPNIWHTMSKNRSSEFVEIDLGSAKSIYFVRVLGRQDCPIVYAGCQERMYEMRLEINMTTTQDALNGFVTNILTSVPSSTIGAKAHAMAIGRYILPTNANDQTIVTNGAIGRYVRVRPSAKKGDGYINISQIIVNDMKGVNISKSRKTYASSSSATTQPPSIVVDGSITARNFPELWQSNTNNRDAEFIEIDLGSSQAISSIEILGRADCTFASWCEDRMAELRVELNDQTTADAAESYPEDATEPEPEPQVYDKTTVQNMIQNAVQQALQEVQVPQRMPDPPVYQEPVSEQAVYQEPVSEQAVYEQPVSEQAVYEEPVYEQPVQAPQQQTVTVNSMSSITPVSITNTASHVTITRKDITLPAGYVRKWDSKARNYVFYDENGQVVSHPSPPSQRVDTSTVKRPAQTGGKVITIGGKKKPVQKGGFTPLATDVRITNDTTVTSPWSKYFDTLKRQYYYHNNSNGNAVWVHPFLPRNPVPGELKYGDAGLPSDWEKYLESSVNTYFYYDPKTGETSWEHPNPPPFPADDAEAIKATGVRGPYVMYRDPATNSLYFFNTDTTETFWVLPNA